MGILSIIQEQKSKFNNRRNEANNLKEALAEEEFLRQKKELATLKERRKLVGERQNLGKEIGSEKAKLLEMGEGKTLDKVKLKLKRMREEARLRQQRKPPQGGGLFGGTGFGNTGFKEM